MDATKIPLGGSRSATGLPTTTDSATFFLGKQQLRDHGSQSHTSCHKWQAHRQTVRRTEIPSRHGEWREGLVLTLHRLQFHRAISHAVISHISSSKTSMNAVTFARRYLLRHQSYGQSLCIYHNALTRQSFLTSKVGVLQLLVPSLKNSKMWCNSWQTKPP